MEVELSEPLLSGSDPPPSGWLLDEDARDDGPPPLERIPTGGAPVVLFSSLVGTQLVRAHCAARGSSAGGWQECISSPVPGWDDGKLIVMNTEVAGAGPAV